MTVTAVALNSDQSSALRNKGVVDSKLLSLNRIRELSRIIQENCTAHHTVTIAPQRFNQLLREIRNEGKTLNDLLAWGHAKAIDNVYEMLNAGDDRYKIRIIIDEFDRIKTERRLSGLLAKSGFVVEQSPLAEENTAVASAGIVARASREEWIDRESGRLNRDLRKLTPVDVTTLPEFALIAKTSFLKHEKG